MCLFLAYFINIYSNFEILGKLPTSLRGYHSFRRPLQNNKITSFLLLSGEALQKAVMSRPNSEELTEQLKAQLNASDLCQYSTNEASTSSFDPYDWQSLYFGTLTREESEEILSRDDVTEGMFLVRDSSTHPGSYVLSVREGTVDDKQFKHYLVNRVPLDETCASPTSTPQYRFKMAGRTFVDFGQVLNFYKSNTLGNCCLFGPVPRHFCRAMAIYDFDGQEASDLSFKKGDILYILQQSDPHWWCAKNELGRSGQIPANFVSICTEANGEVPIEGIDYDVNSNSAPSKGPSHSQSGSNRTSGTTGGTASDNNNPASAFADAVTGLSGDALAPPEESIQLPTLPCKAKAILSRTPCMYQTDQLRMKVGDVLQVTAADVVSGMLDASNLRSGQVGKVPITYIEWF